MFHQTELEQRLQQCNKDADRLLLQLQEKDVRFKQQEKELDEKTTAYNILQQDYKSMCNSVKVLVHSVLLKRNVNAAVGFANADEILLMMLSQCQVCKMRRNNLRSLFKVTVMSFTEPISTHTRREM